MKRSLFFILAVCIVSAYPVNAQTRNLLKKVTNSVAGDIPGRDRSNSGNSKNTQPEPACACDQAEVIFNLGGKLNLNYSELSINVLDDGEILLKDRVSGKYYIASGELTRGPFSEGDPQVAPFINASGDDKDASMATIHKDYISRSGEKYLITFNGKTYGPYAQINSFAVTKSKDKFAAVVLENVAVTEADGKKMEEAIKNAKTDQEKMELAMKYAQDMQKNMMANGGPMKSMPQLVSNIEGATFNPLSGGTINGNMKYDDILVVAYDAIKDLKGNKIISIKPQDAAAGLVFINSGNTKYASYNYGAMEFSDGTKMSDLFNPHFIKTDGKVFLAYMYYSPKKNSIMQCKMPF